MVHRTSLLQKSVITFLSALVTLTGCYSPQPEAICCAGAPTTELQEHCSAAVDQWYYHSGRGQDSCENGENSYWALETTVEHLYVEEGGRRIGAAATTDYRNLTITIEQKHLISPRLYSLVLHEIGHALGAPHNDDPESCMHTGIPLDQLQPNITPLDALAVQRN